MTRHSRIALLLWLQLTICALWGHSFPVTQDVLQDFRTQSILQVRHELIKAEIIPTVVNDFIPFFTLGVSWSDGVSAELGNTIKPKKLQDAPSLTLNDDPTSSFDKKACESNLTYTIALTDPDAPSRDDPKWSEFCHWIATGVPTSSSSSGCILAAKDSLKQVMSYRPPGPPAKTGKHRYVFLIFAPSNGTTLPLNVSKPSERKNWGTGEERHGVRDWAAENGLFPVAANFIYAQNKKQ